MKFFLDAPKSHLELMNYGTAGYFCLAQHYISNAEYKNFFLAKRKEIKATSADKLMILDNGLAEDDQVSIDDLIDICYELKPDIVIPPDSLYDGQETYDLFTLFCDRLFHSSKHHFRQYPSFMICPQGKDLFDYITCIYRMLEIDRYRYDSIRYIGLSKLALPYIYDMTIEDSRQAFVNEILSRCSTLLNRKNAINFHCLGAGSIREFVNYKEPFIKSWDSCVPIWAAMNDVDYESGNDFNLINRRVPTPKDFFDRVLSKDQLSLALKNIAFCIELYS